MPDEPSSQQLEQLPRHMKHLVYVLCATLLLSTIAVVVYAIVMSFKIGLAKNVLPGADAGFIAVTAAIFGILITGVFVFMTFRIDRGAVIEARSTALREAGKVTESARTEARRAAEQAIVEKKAEMLREAGQASEEFALSIANRLREHTITVLQERNDNLASDIPRLTAEDARNG